MADLPFDLAEATRYLAERDARLAELIATTRPFELQRATRRLSRSLLSGDQTLSIL